MQTLTLKLRLTDLSVNERVAGRGTYVLAYVRSSLLKKHVISAPESSAQSPAAANRHEGELALLFFHMRELALLMHFLVDTASFCGATAELFFGHVLFMNRVFGFGIISAQSRERNRGDPSNSVIALGFIDSYQEFRLGALAMMLGARPDPELLSLVFLCFLLRKFCAAAMGVRPSLW